MYLDLLSYIGNLTITRIIVYNSGPSHQNGNGFIRYEIVKIVCQEEFNENKQGDVCPIVIHYG